MKLLKWLDEHFEETVMGLLLMIMTAIMGVQVFSRFVLNASLSWSEEITRYCFVWCGFLSIGLCTRHGISLRVDQLNLVLPKKVAKWLQVITFCAEMVFFAFFIPNAVTYFMPTFRSGRVSVGAEIPMWWLQLAPIVGFILATIRCAEKAILTAVEGKVEAEKSAIGDESLPAEAEEALK
jgi:TRAP-type C4-dicarboxylate transport system permease small subunit